MKIKNVNRILAETPKIYNKIASDFSDTRGIPWGGLGEFAEFINDGDRILDLGCGNGRLAEIFAGKKVEYSGIDNSQELIGIARERHKDKANYRFEVGDILEKENWKIEMGKFDLVLMIAVLHHIPTRKLRLRALENAHRALKPGGRLIISNWNLWKADGRKKFRYYPYLFNYAEKIRRGVWRSSDAFVPWKANLRQAEWQARYVHSFAKREMNKLLVKSGFAIERIGYATKKQEPALVLTGDNLLAVAIKK